MASNNYYLAHPLSADQQQQQHLLSPALSSPGISSGQSSGQSTPVKPLHLVSSMNSHAHSQYDHPYEDFEALDNVKREDELLKARIRRFRLVSRVLAFLISIGVFIPIALTLHKFFTTQNIHREVKGKSRTAWAKNSRTWPTWMYFLVAGIAVLLNLVILVSYLLGGVKHANRAAVISSVFTWVVMVGNLVVWIVAASLYRTEKDKNGKSDDLWGWTCSAAARAIQKEFAQEVNFDRFCNVQSISWYIGLVQVAAAALTVFIYVLVFMRRKKQKAIEEHSRSLPGFFRAGQK